MTTRLDLAINFDAAEVLSEAEAPGAVSELARTLRADAFSFSQQYNANTTPAASGGPVVQQITLGGSATVIDFSTAPLLGSRSGDMSTKRVIAYALLAGASNAGDVTVAPHGVDGYPFFKHATNGLILAPGQIVAASFRGVASVLAAVDANTKNLAVSGTVDDTCDLAILFGA